MMIPLRAELRIAHTPIVTYAIVVLCIAVFLLQSYNKNSIKESAQAYCDGITRLSAPENNLDFLSYSPRGCASLISSYYGIKDQKYISYFFKRDYYRLSLYSDIFTNENYFETLRIFQNHINDFSVYAPTNLSGALMYDPSTLNPVTMVTSVLAHGGFFHILFNLVFFLAFAPALEALVGNTWRFLGVIGLMILGTNLVYALSMLTSFYPTPTLGLSGIVSGMMGFALSFMPKARIRTFYYFIIIPTPVWLLSLYYIGFDIFDLYTRTDHGGVNVVVHVAGGIIGFFMMMLFRQRHREVSGELNKEIEFMRANRQSLVDSDVSTSEIEQKLKHEENEKTERLYLETLHKYISVDAHSEVINKILSDYAPEHTTIERYEYLLEQMSQWKKGRSYDCLARLIINLKLDSDLKGAALRVAKQLFQQRGKVILANPEQVIPLASYANEIQEYKLAYELIHDIRKRYGNLIDINTCLLLEIGLLHLHLERSAEALRILKNVFDDRTHPLRRDVLEYSRKIGLIGAK